MLIDDNGVESPKQTSGGCSRSKNNPVDECKLMQIGAGRKLQFRAVQGSEGEAQGNVTNEGRQSPLIGTLCRRAILVGDYVGSDISTMRLQEMAPKESESSSLRSKHVDKERSLFP